MPFRRPGCGSAAAALDAIDNIGGWLTTVVARICLDMLRSRKTRREEPFDLPVHERLADTSKAVDPEQEVAFAELCRCGVANCPPDIGAG